ncbi:transcription factor E2F3 [Grus japonensis]|uniref:Transcription factor E2F3 n=1 Tax=Grus japonensis TaxID=30415 RepID=A0ABC9WF50_GRUJA
MIQAKRRLELGESGHQYLAEGLKTPKGKGRAATRSPDSPKMITLAYVTYQDIRKISGLKDQTVIVVKAPPETRLEVPDPVESALIHLSSTQGPIEVYLCPEENDALSPMKTYNQDHNGNISKTISKAEVVVRLAEVYYPRRIRPCLIRCLLPVIQCLKILKILCQQKI